MEHLGLPHPKQIDIAVPANLRCGQPEGDLAPRAEPSWAPLSYTFGGVWEIEPHALDKLLDKVQIVDVREHMNSTAPSDTFPARGGSRSANWAERTEQLDRRPAGRCRVPLGRALRRALAVLQKAGFADAANLAGGMLRWRAEGCVVEGGAQ